MTNAWENERARNRKEFLAKVALVAARSRGTRDGARVAREQLAAKRAEVSRHATCSHPHQPCACARACLSIPRRQRACRPHSSSIRRTLLVQTSCRDA